MTGEAADLAFAMGLCELGEGDKSTSDIEDMVAYAQILRVLAVPTLLSASICTHWPTKVQSFPEPDGSAD